MAIISAKRLVFRGKQEVELERIELGDPKSKEVRIRTDYSLMSTGTENIAFNRNFDPGTHWDDWVRYPFYPGYAIAGIVESVGTDVTVFKEGEAVVCRANHSSHWIAPEAMVFPLPEGIGLDQAPWFALAKIALHGALAADYRLGDTVVIIGAGPIGQMSLRWAIASGAGAVVVVDPIVDRERFAKAGGAAAYLSLPVGEVKSLVRELLGGEEPKVVIDTTGHSAVFPHALGLAGVGGRVVILGDTGSPRSQALTSDALIKGLSIVGAHDGNKIAGWEPARMIRVLFQLVKAGRFSLEGLNTHCFVPEECEAAYGIANRDRAQTMGILFDWRGSGGE